MPNDVILIVHAMSTLAMVGLIWFVQVVHYPLLARLDTDSSPRLALENQRRTSRVVVPLMLAEGTTATLLVFQSVSWVDRTLSATGLALLAIIWISTVAVQMPCHRRLAEAYDETDARRLVSTNWVRTIAWTLRGLTAMAVIRW
jgi:hypothetical protein